MVKLDSILIIGEYPITQAISQVLELFGADCKQASIPLQEKPPNYILVIAITSNYFEIIPMIHQLRTHFNWPGRFIAVLPSLKDMESLHNLGLFGDSSYPRYQDILGQGHATVCYNQPDFLINLIDLVVNKNKLKIVHKSGWNKLVKTWNLPQKIKKILKADYTLDQKIIQLDELMDDFAKINWELWLGHYDKSAIILIQDYKRSKLTSVEDITEILERMKTVFKKAKLGGLFQ